jgi:hypothetical protein
MKLSPGARGWRIVAPGGGEEEVALKQFRAPLAVLLIVGSIMLACGESGSVSTTPADVAEQPTQRPTFTPIPTEGEGPTEPPPPTNTPEGPTPTPAPPTDTPPPTATQPPTNTPPPPLQIQGVTEYTDSIGALHLVGEVLNQSDQNMNFVKIIASFYDSADRIVATDFTYTELDTVEAGDSSPFEMIILNPPDTIDTYKLDVEWNVTNVIPLHVDVLSHNTSTDSIGAYHVVGEVQNPYDHSLEFVKIVATFYSAEGKVLRSDFTYTGRDTIGPGETSPFELVLLNPPADMDHYKLQTQARKVG